MPSNKITAKDFFNSISSSYISKYRKEKPFHYYFFIERLNKSLKNIEINESKILDIGAGTGGLFDFLTEKKLTFTYTGTDISENMLNNSNIPENSRFVGNAYQIQLPFAKYDKVFMLGVGTYMDVSEFQKHLNFFKTILTDYDSEIIISFTNQNCIDSKMRGFLKPLISILANRKTVLSQNFPISKYSLGDVKEIIKNSGLKLNSVEWLNHTVFPFNLIFKNISISLAERIDKLENQRFLSLLSSDFLVKLSLNSSLNEKI